MNHSSKLSSSSEVPDAIAGADVEVVVAFGADVLRALDVLFEKSGPAVLAREPEPFGHSALAARHAYSQRHDFLFLTYLTKPGVSGTSIVSQVVGFPFSQMQRFVISECVK